MIEVSSRRACSVLVTLREKTRVEEMRHGTGIESIPLYYRYSRFSIRLSCELQQFTRAVANDVGVEADSVSADAIKFI